MRCGDTNVLVYAFRADPPENGTYRALLEEWANDDEPLGTPDAYVAAYEIENNATFLNADRGFARFSRLRWRHPLESFSGS